MVVAWNGAWTHTDNRFVIVDHTSGAAGDMSVGYFVGVSYSANQRLQKCGEERRSHSDAKE